MTPATSLHPQPTPGERHCEIAGNRVTIKATMADSGGAYALYETLVARGGGMPPHLHRYEDEALFVLDGTFAITIGAQTIAAEPGAWMFGPRGVPHAFRNIGEAPGRLLVLVSPGTLQEQFIAEVGRPTDALDTPQQPSPRPISLQDLAWLAARAEKYGLEFLSLDHPTRRA